MERGVGEEEARERWTPVDRKRSLFAAAMDCESRSRAFLKYDHPLNTSARLYCFSFTRLPFPPCPFRGRPLFIPRAHSSCSLSFPACPHLPFFPNVLLRDRQMSRRDITRARADPSACSDMSTVIVISALIRRLMTAARPNDENSSSNRLQMERRLLQPQL